MRRAPPTILDGLKAIGRTLFEGLNDRGVERPGHIGAQRLQVDRRVVLNGMKESGRVGAPERQLARQKLVGDDAQRPDVGASIDMISGGLLGRHVGDGAHRDAGGGQPRFRRGFGRVVRGESEIEDLRERRRA